MKIRNGFVSNSSSSSFIIGWGQARDINILEEYLKNNNISFTECGYEPKKNSVYDFGTNHPYDITVYAKGYLDGNERILQGGNVTEIIVPRHIAEGYSERVITVCIHNDEGDGSVFWPYNPDNPDADVDSEYEKAKDIEFYSEHQQKIIKMLEDKNLFVASKVIIGAERNG